MLFQSEALSTTLTLPTCLPEEGYKNDSSALILEFQVTGNGSGFNAILT